MPYYSPPPVPHRTERSPGTPCVALAGALGALACAGLVLGFPSASQTQYHVASPATHVRRPLVSQGLVAHAANKDVDSFREKLMSGAISQRRMEKWTSKGREAKQMREMMQELQEEAAEQEEEPEEPAIREEELVDEAEEDIGFVDVTTDDSFTFGDEVCLAKPASRPPPPPLPPSPPPNNKGDTKGPAGHSPALPPVALPICPSQCRTAAPQP